jgi:DNA-directed RNA polymerase subunit RPC12/RpoP
MVNKELAKALDKAVIQGLGTVWLGYFCTICGRLAPVDAAPDKNGCSNCSVFGKQVLIEILIQRKS